jgi:hypothetical protein
MSRLGCCQHQCRLPVRKRSDHTGSSPDLANDTLQFVVCFDLPPVRVDIGAIFRKRPGVTSGDLKKAC